jgi:MbtH protein
LGSRKLGQDSAQFETRKGSQTSRESLAFAHPFLEISNSSWEIEMDRSAELSQPRFEVVKNVNGQYSIWPVNRQLPVGWNKVDWAGSKGECLDYIEKAWIDMRPQNKVPIEKS